jgi:hypothetical protein
MVRPLVCALTVLTGLASTTTSVAQVGKPHSVASHDSVMTDKTLGITFFTIGEAARHVENGYSMSLQSTGGRIRSATAGVSVSRKRFVDLSGSYGGRLYLDDPKATRLLKNRAKVDTIDIGGLRFRREFWAAYAGMGMWEGVINCYALRNHQYYVLSLNADITLGKPGEVVEGGRLSAELLRSRLLDILNDTREPVIQQFNNFLSSFQMNK